MAKFYTPLLALFICTNFYSQTVLSEDFETGNPTNGTLPSGWTTVQENTTTGNSSEIWIVKSGADAPVPFAAGNGYMYDTTIAGFTGNYAIFDSDAYGDNNTPEQAALISPAFDCSSKPAGANVVLNMKHFIYALTGQSVQLQISQDGTNYTTVATIANTSYGSYSLNITDAVGSSSTAYLKILYIGNWSYFYAVDDISISFITENVPNAAENLNPVDGATDVPINVSTTGAKQILFDWQAANTGDSATSFNWYGGTSADNLDLSVTGANAGNYINWGTTIISGWQANTTYYWRIGSINSAGETLTDIQSFTTVNNDPLSIDELLIKNLELYPNPTEGIISVDGIDLNEIDEIEVINQLGQKVKKYESDNLTSNSLDISELEKGLYYFKIKTKSNLTKNFKIIKK
jgi:hypothetical protein